MRAHYDFASMPSRKNPYAKMLKQPVTIRLDRDTVAYFKSLAVKTGLPYQHLINLYLRDCASRRTEIEMHWHAPAARPVVRQKRARKTV
jgi:uncharacterized protein (DUF4415 family)